MAENFGASNGHCPCNDIFVSEHPKYRKSKYSRGDHALLHTIFGCHDSFGCLGLPNHYTTTCALLFEFESS